MTHSKGTSALLALAFGLLAYILFFERHLPGTAGPDAPPPLLFPELDVEKVTRLEITRSPGIIHAERHGAQWQLTDPVYPAQSQLVQGWLASLVQLRERARVTAQDLQSQPGGLAAFGLDPPRALVGVEQDGTRIQFRLGGRTPLGEKMYLQRVGAEGVFITDSQPLDRLPDTANSWRDPTFLQLAGRRFDRLQMRAAGREFEVVRDVTNHVWRLLRPRSARADTGRVEQILQQLQALRVVQYVNDFPSADLEPYGLQSPEVALTLSEESNVVLTVELGRSPTNAPDTVFARRSSHPGIVAVPRQALDLVAVPYTELLDYQLCDFPLELADRVEVRAAEPFVLQKQPAGNWRVVEPSQFAADPALVQEFLAKLKSLRIADVAKEVVTDLDLPAYGLAPPRREYNVRWVRPGSAGGPSTVRLDFGTNQADRVYARRADENSVYSVRAEDCVFLPEAAFELRDRRIWNFTTNQVASVTMVWKGETRKLLRSATGQWTFAPGSQGIVNTFALEEAVYRLGRLWARAWVAEGAESLQRFGFTETAHRLTIELNQSGKGQSLTVDFGTTSPSGGPYAWVPTEEGPAVFEFPLEIFYPYQEVLKSMAGPNQAAR